MSGGYAEYFSAVGVQTSIHELQVWELLLFIRYLLTLIIPFYPWRVNSSWLLATSAHLYPICVIISRLVIISNFWVRAVPPGTQKHFSLKLVTNEQLASNRGALSIRLTVRVVSAPSALLLGLSTESRTRALGRRKQSMYHPSCLRRFQMWTSLHRRLDEMSSLKTSRQDVRLGEPA